MKEPPSDPRSDEALVDATNDGDAEAFASLYYRYRDWVARLALRFTGDRDEAMDVLQETFAYLHRKFPGFALRAPLTTFLYPAVRNLALEARRKRLRLHVDGPAALDRPDPHPAAPADDDLTAILSRLPELHREALLMRFVDEMSIAEIAAALSIPEGTVKSRLHNAIATLREERGLREWFIDR